jgi:uracil-DNA glycosylase
VAAASSERIRSNVSISAAQPVSNLTDLLQDIRRCRVCADHLPLGPRPVVQIGPTARLCIIGQAPGTRVHDTGIPWNDASGERLRLWTDIDRDTFYDPARVAIMPMGFCYPGVHPNGGDKPPRPECAPLWHKQLQAHLSRVKLTLVIGHYAQRAYLHASRRQSMTETVRDYRLYLPAYFPLPHPSWRTAGWQKRNAWFDHDVLPELRQRVQAALALT